MEKQTFRNQKNVRLNNNDLESLIYDNDDLIKKFALEIIYKLDDPELFPSWYLREYYKNELSAIIDTINNETLNITEDLKNRILKLENKIRVLNSTKIKTERKLKKADKKYNRVNKKIEAINCSKKIFFYVLFPSEYIST